MHHLLTEEVGLGLGIGRVQIIPEEESVKGPKLLNPKPPKPLNKCVGEVELTKRWDVSDYDGTVGSSCADTFALPSVNESAKNAPESEEAEQQPQSEKPEKREIAPNGDQRRPRHYKDHVDQPDSEVMPAPELCPNIEGGKYKQTAEEARKALSKFMSETGSVKDLEVLYNCPVSIIKEHPAFEMLTEYQENGQLFPLKADETGEVIKDANGEAAFVEVGTSKDTGKRPGRRKKPERVTRAFKDAVKAVIKTGGVSARAADELEKSLGFCMPPEEESDLVDSLTAHSGKIYRAVPRKKTRYLLEKCASAIAENQPAATWTGNDIPVSVALRHYILTAEDKSVGYAQHTFPGTRANIQKDESKICKVITLAKIRLALRVSLAHVLPYLRPFEMVKLNLQDIAVVFDKGEGHSARKVEEKRWRLIWSVSEVDRILDAFVSYDQSHFDVITHQGEFGDLASLATGCGHDDTGLERTYRDLEALLAASPDNSVRNSDASHWDLSVSAATFWTANQGLDVSRADGLCHKRMVVLNGYFASNFCLSTGTRAFESQRMGITTG